MNGMRQPQANGGDDQMDIDTAHARPDSANPPSLADVVAAFMAYADQQPQRSGGGITGQTGEAVARNTFVRVSEWELELLRLALDSHLDRVAYLESGLRALRKETDRPGIEHAADMCPHGKYEWEDCSGCHVAQIDAILSGAWVGAQ